LSPEAIDYFEVAQKHLLDAGRALKALLARSD